MDRPTKTIMGEKAYEAMKKGVESIYFPVKTSFGPEGRSSLLFRTFNRGGRVTDDGYTIAECQEPEDPFVNLVANHFKESCKKTNELCGDGTTCTVVTGGSLFLELFDSYLNKKNDGFGEKQIGVMSLKKKLIEEKEKVKEKIKQQAKKIETLEDLEKIATVSVKDGELGKLIAGMAWKVGVDGHIDVTEGYKGIIETEVIQGMRFPAKVPAKAFVNNPSRYEMVLKDYFVLITNHSVDNMADLNQLLPNTPIRRKTSKIIIIAPAFSDTVLINMVNSIKGGFFVYPVHVPSLRTEQMEDVATYCGATLIDKNKGMTLLGMRDSDLGFIEKLVVKDTENREDAVMIGGKGEHEETITDTEIKNGQKTYTDRISTRVKERVEMLKKQKEETREAIHKKLLDRRIASLASVVGVIRVGDSTQGSSNFTKMKIEDAVYACKTALRGGYIRGGGLPLKEIAEEMDDENVLKKCLLSPYSALQASIPGGIEVKPEIIDPMESIYYAVEHAVSVVATLITVDKITIEAPDPDWTKEIRRIGIALSELTINDKIHKGIIRENEREMERDRMGGLTEDELIATDNG